LEQRVLLRNLGRFEEAVASYDEAVKLNLMTRMFGTIGVLLL
jgi:hypothetical protein